MPPIQKAVQAAALAGGLTLLAACGPSPVAPPEVTASFVATDVFYLTIAGGDDEQAPMLRQRFYQEAEVFARSSGCLSYRVIKENFTTSANINPRLNQSPSWVFGKRPLYSGTVHCELPPTPTASRGS